MLATIGVQPSEVSNILNLAKSSLSQSNGISNSDSRKSAKKMNQSRDNDFDIYDLLDDEDGSIESTFAKEYATHHEDIGEVLKNIADIDIDPKKVTSVANRVIRDIGRTDANARELLSTEIQTVRTHKAAVPRGYSRSFGN